MTIEEAKIEYIVMVNRNGTNNNAGVDDTRFILSFNKRQNKAIEDMLEKRNEDDIRYIQQISVPEFKLTFTSAAELHDKYGLPGNYFDLEDINVWAKRGCCDERELLPTELKTEDKNELRFDDNNKPSFDWEQTKYFIANGQVCVLRGDFEITKVLLSYYRYPVQVDIAGYFNTMTQLPSTSIDPEFDDKFVLKILNDMATEFFANSNDPANFQLNQARKQ